MVKVLVKVNSCLYQISGEKLTKNELKQNLIIKKYKQKLKDKEAKVTEFENKLEGVTKEKDKYKQVDTYI